MWSIDIQNWPFYYALSALLAASLLMCWRIRRTKFGMGLIAMREDEDKAATVGVDTPIYKLLGFVASAVFVGMAGAVYGYYLAFIDPIGMFNILHQRPDPAVDAARRPRDAVGAGARRVPDRAAERVLQQLARRRQRAAARLRRADGARRAVPAARDPADGRGVARGAPHARQGRAGRRAAGAARAAAPAARPALSGRALLEVDGLEKRFGGLRAVDGARSRSPRGLDHRADRAERLGQDDRVQPDRRDDGADAGEVLVRRRRIDGCGRGGARTSASAARSRSRGCSAR